MQILESDKILHFHIQQQVMIELIRKGRIHDAIEFAQENLAYKGEENPSFLEDLGMSSATAGLYTSWR
jgi:glucose-induced degradation protein 8